MTCRLTLRAVLSCAVLACAGSLVMAGTAAATIAKASVSACSGPEFDRAAALVGDWDAMVGDKIIGRDMLASRLQRCAIEEQWTDARGMNGTSLTVFDAVAKRWRQFWIDDSGTVAALEGGFDGDALVLEGDSNQAGGNSKRVRGTWRPSACTEAKGRCTIHVSWESQDAQGKAWTPMYEFDQRRHE
jgi:hypothetical protein